MLQKAEAGQRMMRVVELLILQSLAYHGEERQNYCSNHPGPGRVSCPARRVQRVFLDEGELVMKMLHMVKSNQDATGYASELLEAFGPISNRACTGPALDRAAEHSRNRSPEADRGRAVQSGNCIEVIHIDYHRETTHQQHLRQA